MVIPRIDSKHNGKCDRPVAPLKKATEPYVNSTGSLTMLRPDSPVKTPGEHRNQCQHSIESLRYQPQLQMRTTTLAATGKESREGPRNSHGDWTFLRQHERVPEVAVLISCRNSRKSRRFSAQREMRHFPAASSQEKKTPSHLAWKGSTPLRQLKYFPEITFSTREEHQRSCHNSTRSQ